MSLEDVFATAAAEDHPEASLGSRPATALVAPRDPSHGVGLRDAEMQAYCNSLAVSDSFEDAVSQYFQHCSRPPQWNAFQRFVFCLATLYEEQFTKWIHVCAALLPLDNVEVQGPAHNKALKDLHYKEARGHSSTYTFSTTELCL